MQAGQDYLNDVEVWFKITQLKDDGTDLAEPPSCNISEFHHAIRKIEIKIDGKQIMMLDHARYLLSIQN